MPSYRILSWNVNGIRAVVRKGFLEWFKEESPDIICLQETKAQPEQVTPETREPSSYHAYWNSAERKGYSGVLTYSKVKPLKVEKGLGIPRFDSEGRTLITDFGDFVLYNIYFPNGKRSQERLDYKMEFYDAFLEHAERTRKDGKGIVVCGDFNTAHKEIDLARPRENSNVSGFLPMERAWLDKLVQHGYLDTFRRFNDQPNEYSWWDYKSRARDRNVGWRIDYFFASIELEPNLKDAFILQNVHGSDHCPVGIELEF